MPSAEVAAVHAAFLQRYGHGEAGGNVGAVF